MLTPEQINAEIIYCEKLNKISKIKKEMQDNDWKQLRAWRHYMNNALTQEDRDVLAWFEQKAQEINELEK